MSLSDSVKPGGKTLHQVHTGMVIISLFVTFFAMIFLYPKLRNQLVSEQEQVNHVSNAITHDIKILTPVCASATLLSYALEHWLTPVQLIKTHPISHFVLSLWIIVQCNTTIFNSIAQRPVFSKERLTPTPSLPQYGSF